MKTNNLLCLSSFCIFALLSSGSAADAQVALSGIALYSTDGSGNFLDDGWNTLGGDVMYNLWVSVNGNAVNGPTDTFASINFPLMPGTYNFSISGDSGRNRSFHGLNLFFNGDNSVARISVMTPTANNTSVTSFSINQSARTPNLAYTSSAQPTTGVSSFTSGGLNVAITGFRWEYSFVESQDSVSPFTQTSNGKLDNQGIFILTVSGPNNSTISGTVLFSGITALAPSQNVTFEFRPTDNSGNFTKTVSVAPTGAFNISVPLKNYVIHIKSPLYLATNVSANATNGSVSGLQVSMQPGDANNDNFCDATDFGLFVSAYNSKASVPGSGYDPNCDFTGDGSVDATDFGLFVGNYNTAGDL